MWCSWKRRTLRSKRVRAALALVRVNSVCVCSFVSSRPCMPRRHHARVVNPASRSASICTRSVLRIVRNAEAATIKFDQVFQTSDLNEDGFLCFKEMNVYATCTGGALFEDDFNAMSKALGCKKKKKLLTKEQFVRCYTEFGTGDIHDDHKALYKYQADAADAQKKKAEEDAAAAAAARQGKSKYDQLFDAADTDGDGFLDYKEMCVYAGRTGGTLSMEDFHELTGALGARVENTPWADGMVSREQFKLCYTKYQTGDIDEDHRSFFAAVRHAYHACQRVYHCQPRRCRRASAICTVTQCECALTHICRILALPHLCLKLRGCA